MVTFSDAYYFLFQFIGLFGADVLAYEYIPIKWLATILLTIWDVCFIFIVPRRLPKTAVQDKPSSYGLLA